MFEIMPESDGKTVGVRASGKLTDHDYRDFLVPKLEALFERYESLDVLIYMDDDFEGWDLEAAWDDAVLGFTHRSDFGKLAVVGAPAWVNACIAICGPLMKGDIRIFSAGGLSEAWAWLQA